MKQIAKIDVIFENCEFFSLDASDLKFVNFDQFGTMIRRIACNCVAKIVRANYIELHVKKGLNDRYDSFGQQDRPASKLERLQGCDITSFEIFFEDGTSESIYVDWSDESEYINKYQSYFFDDDGSLVVVISETGLRTQ